MRKFIAIIAVVTAAFVAMPASAASPLEKEMKALGKIVKDLKKSDKDFDKAAKLAQEANAQVKKCAELTPSTAEKEKDEKAKSAMLDDYRKGMEQLTQAFGEVEAAAKAKDKDKLATALENLDKVKDAGHKALNVK